MIEDGLTREQLFSAWAIGALLDNSPETANGLEYLSWAIGTLQWLGVSHGAIKSWYPGDYDALLKLIEENEL